MIYTTLNKIRERRPCRGGWEELLASLGKRTADDEPLAMTTILDSNGLQDALWCLRACDEKYEPLWRLYAVWCVRALGRLLTDSRSRASLDVAEKHARGRVSDEELAAARIAAFSASADALWAVALARNRGGRSPALEAVASAARSAASAVIACGGPGARDVLNTLISLDIFTAHHCSADAVMVAALDALDASARDSLDSLGSVEGRAATYAAQSQKIREVFDGREMFGLEIEQPPARRKNQATKEEQQ